MRPLGKAQDTAVACLLAQILETYQISGSETK